MHSRGRSKTPQHHHRLYYVCALPLPCSENDFMRRVHCARSHDQGKYRDRHGKFGSLAAGAKRVRERDTRLAHQLLRVTTAESASTSGLLVKSPGDQGFPTFRRCHCHGIVCRNSNGSIRLDIVVPRRARRNRTENDVEEGWLCIGQEEEVAMSFVRGIAYESTALKNLGRS